MTTTSIPIILKLEDRTEIEQWVAVMCLGMGTAIAGGSLSIAEAESRLFNPYTLGRLETLGMPQDLIDIVHLGTELEDIQSLAPNRLSDSITEIQTKALAFLSASRCSASPHFQAKKWI